ncbi:hypothetical protein FB567DRAFT_597333 [Paraphoma chrysanthemicola]|uniref:C3H1-type domain-containing protein n=1 Tax=Paraphoma chrysanthemicola TaxID=798071 RepID=A0A8K0VU67_9PLEO|nr:hypothetical protein FB567DRAFT_597333 [Paraphoma chrysanthemicola]
MSEGRATGSVMGKRRRSMHLTDTPPPRGDYNVEPVTKRRKKVARATNVPKSTNNACNHYVALSEGVERAERRASLDSKFSSNARTTRPRNATKSNKQSNHTDTSQFGQVMNSNRQLPTPSLSSEDEDVVPLTDLPNTTMQAIWETPKVAQALKEYHAAQDAINEEPITQVASLRCRKHNVFAPSPSHASLSPSTSSETQSIDSTSVEEPSTCVDAAGESVSQEGKKGMITSPEASQDACDDDGEVGPLAGGESALAPASKCSVVETSAPSQIIDEACDADKSLIEFNRRLTSAVHALASKSCGMPQHDETGDVEDSSDSKPQRVAISERAESETVAALTDMIKGMARNQEATREATEKLLIANQVECQRLATLIATQPPSAPSASLPEPRKETQAILDIARVLGAIDANAARQIVRRAFQSWNHLVAEKPTPLPNLNIQLENPYLAHQGRSDYFCSTNLCMEEKPQRTTTVPMSMEQMLCCLKADEARYIRDFQTSPFQVALPGGVLVRHIHKSQYPLRDALAEKQEERLMQQQAVLMKPTVLKAGSQKQLNVVDAKVGEPEPSWQMEDLQSVGKQNTTFSTAPTNNTYQPGQPLVFAQSNNVAQHTGSRESNAAPSGSNVANICKYFLAGGCRFGDRCRNSHIMPNAESATRQPSSDTPNIQRQNEQLAETPLPWHIQSINNDNYKNISTAYRDLRNRAIHDDQVNASCSGFSMRKREKELDDILRRANRQPSTGMEGDLEWIIEQGGGLADEDEEFKRQIENDSRSASNQIAKNTSSSLKPNLVNTTLDGYPELPAPQEEYDEML